MHDHRPQFRRRGWHILALAATTLLTLMPNRGFGDDAGALQILQHLYMSNGQPIQDMIINADLSKPATAGDGGNLKQVSHDKIFFKRPNRLRDDSTLIDPGGAMDGTVRTVIRDGTNAWMYISLSPKPVKQALDSTNGSILLPYFLQRYSQDSDREYAIVGHQTVDGVSTEVIRITTDSPSLAATVWVDTHRWVPLKLERPVVVKGSKKPSLHVTLFKDVRPLSDGRFWPLHLELMVDDDVETVVEYKAVSVNVGLPDSMFYPMAKYIKPADHP